MSYEIIQRAVGTEGVGGVTCAALAPTGKVITGVGYRFRNESGADRPAPLVSMQVIDLNWWVVEVSNPEPGTLTTYATCTDA